VEESGLDAGLVLSSGLLATAGGLVIRGDGGRGVFALDAKTGSDLWEVPLGSTVGGYPMTYMVDGVQYLVISDRIEHPSPILAAAYAGKHRACRSQAREGIGVVGV
jgi:alcohol dehydrogenase (cytochrome c)